MEDIEAEMGLHIDVTRHFNALSSGLLAHDIAQVCIYMNTHVSTNIYIYIYIHMYYIYVYVYVYVYIYIYIYI